MYNAVDIARYVIERCSRQNKTISNLKLQKILYFIQAEFLIAKHQPCFAEKIQAWDFGPVVPEVYYTYSMYREVRGFPPHFGKGSGDIKRYH